MDEVEAFLEVPPGHIRFDDVAQDAAFGVEHNEARPYFLGEGEEVKLSAQAAVVAAFGLGDALFVGGEFVLRGPRRSVDPLESVARLIALPVRGGGLRQRKPVPNEARGRQMRAAAQVGPHDGAVARAIVVHRQCGPADLDGGALGPGALRADELEFVGLAGKFGGRVGVRDLAAAESLPLLDDPLHPLFQVAQELGRHGVDVPEIVIETVRYERADSEVGVGKDLLDRLCEDVGGRMAEDVQTVVA